MSADAQHLTRARFAEMERELAAVTAQRDELLDAAACVLHDWHSETGFVSTVRNATGRAWPWEHGEEGLATLRSTIAKIRTHP